ncbi:hypothetical protein BDN71DRAFT_1433873 [Pleurotus eryngii]|uniref:Uncharacterized protein n=1 Tax=Pleurotus eryngii TaxID=5323 RepID=A0A9P6D3V0_PLEER|nr:hypothetical protein BDN71DRAFT_1433873 [Pleurotus eryngii]
MYKNKDHAFFEVACILFFDRFLPPSSDPMCTKYHLEVDTEVRNFALAVMLYSCHPNHRDTDDKRLHITLPADRQCQQDEWLAKGSGQPVDYQYIVAFEDEDEFVEEFQYMDLEGHIYY